MLRIMKITGLSAMEITEITSYFMGTGIVCVIVGNAVFYLLKGYLELIGLLIGKLIRFIKKHIVKKGREIESRKKGMQVKSSRRWLLTFGGEEGHGHDHERIKAVLASLGSVIYWCMCDEISKQYGTCHTHLFIVCDSDIPLSTVRERFPVAHIDQCRGHAQDIRDYIRKEGEYAWCLMNERNIKETFEEMCDCPIETGPVE